MSDKDKRVVSCGAVAWRQNEGKTYVLLIQQFIGKSTWGIPKGHMKTGETFEQCAMREVKEETGVQVTLGKRLADTVMAIKDGTKTVIAFLGEPVGDTTPKLDDPENEVADAQWFDLDALPDIQWHQKLLIQEAVKVIKDGIWDMQPTKPSDDS